MQEHLTEGGLKLATAGTADAKTRGWLKRVAGTAPGRTVGMLRQLHSRYPIAVSISSFAAFVTLVVIGGLALWWFDAHAGAVTAMLLSLSFAL